MKKPLAATALIASLAGTAIAIASPHRTAAAVARHDLRTTAKVTFAHTLDMGRPGPSPGDITIFGGLLTGPDITGRYQAYCINMSATAQECTETLITPHGQVTAQAAYGHASAALTPITGGSGTYSGARGDVSERESNGGSTVHLVLHLHQ